jgi:hypothetical protein
MNPQLSWFLASLATLLPGTVLVAVQAEAAATTAAPPSASQLRCLAAKEICVTLGSVGQDKTGKLEINAPKTRAVSTVGYAHAAELRFTYLGPTDQVAALRSGQVRRQFGLKLRAQNGCNLVYVIWRLEPKAELVISVKSNPGMRTNAECHTSGYQNIKATKSSPMPALNPGDSRRLRAVLSDKDDGLQVFLDDALIWSGQLGAKALEADGPVGFRTDNVHLITDLCQSASADGQVKETVRCGQVSDEE